MSLLYEITQNQNAKYLHLVIAALFQITMNYGLFAYLDGSQQNSYTNVIQTNTVVNCYVHRSYTFLLQYTMLTCVPNYTSFVMEFFSTTNMYCV